jgi:hypothetical protein
MEFKIDLYDELLPQNLGLSEAKNVYEFVFSPEFLGFTRLFPLQEEVLRGFFDEVCPDCSVGGDVVWMEYGRCSRCGKTKIDFYREGKAHFYNEIVGVAGTKSGKTTLIGSIVAPYILHKLLFRIRDVRDLLGLVPWETLLFVFNATSREQAQLTGWSHFLSTVRNSVWFKHYIGRLKERVKDLNLRMDEVISETTTRLEFKFCKLLCGCFHSNAFSLAGGTFYFVMIDELSRFERTDSRRSAAEIVRVSKNNLFPVRAGFARLLSSNDPVVNNLYDGILAVVSAPLLEDDKTMQLLDGAKREKRRFVFYRSTFEANPDADRSLIAADEEEDPERVMRDFDAVPRSVGSQFFSDASVLNRCALGTQKLFNWTVDMRNMGMVGSRLNIRLMLRLLDSLFDKTKVLFIHADAGRVKDSFGIVVATADGGVTDYKVYIHEVIEIRPLVSVKGFQEVDFESVFEFLKRLSENFVIGAISYDRWNSVSHVQGLRNLGLTVEDINLKYEDFLAFRQDVLQGKVVFPKPEVEDWYLRGLFDLPPVSKLLKELYMLRDFGRRIDHPPGGSSDLAVCAVGVHRLVLRYHVGQSSVRYSAVAGRGMARYPGRGTGMVIRLNRFR